MDGGYMAAYVAGMNIIVIAAVKMIVSSAVKRFDKRTDDLWNAIHTHGHKGLNGDDAKVTR